MTRKTGLIVVAILALALVAIGVGFGGLLAARGQSSPSERHPSGGSGASGASGNSSGPDATPATTGLAGNIRLLGKTPETVLVGTQVPLGFQLACPGRAISVADCAPRAATLTIDGKEEKLVISGATAGSIVTFQSDHTYHFEFVTVGGLPGRWPDTGSFTTRVIDPAKLPRETASTADLAPTQELTLERGDAADQVGYKNTSEDDVKGPSGFDIDADGNALIVDWVHRRVMKATLAGDVSVVSTTPQPMALDIVVDDDGTRYLAGSGSSAHVFSQRPGAAVQDLTAQFGNGVASGLAKIGDTVVLVRGGGDRVPLDGGEATSGVVASKLDESTVVMTRPNGTLVGVQAPATFTFGQILMQSVAKNGSVAAVQLLSTDGDPTQVGVQLIRATDDDVVGGRTPLPSLSQSTWRSTVRWDVSTQQVVENESTLTAFHLRWYEV